MLAKLFSHNLKDGALKWYFTIFEKSVDSYENLIHLFIQDFKYNIVEKSQFKDLCKIKQLSNQSLIAFVRVWKKNVNKIIVDEKYLKDVFIASLLPQCRLEVIDLDNFSLGKLIGRLLKNKSCIVQIYQTKTHTPKTNNDTAQK